LVNAGGAWSNTIAETILRLPGASARLSRISQIVVRRLFDHDNVYVLQNDDRRIVFAIPFERDFTLIAGIERELDGDPSAVSASAADISYLCAAANRYFRERIEPADIVHAMSGPHLRPGGFASRWRHPDGFMSLNRKYGEAPLLTVFGGVTTTARRRAEIAMNRLSVFFMTKPAWTAMAPLPGGDFSSTAFADQIARAQLRWPFLSERHAHRLVHAYGTRIDAVLGDAASMDGLGPRFGENLTGIEVRYLMENEWARFADDILWRRSKLGLTMPMKDREALAQFMAQVSENAVAVPA
jgi:glycerol-3-phosphate dehydrogenase